MDASDKQENIRVAIVGGGCAALTAAFELSDPKHKGRYQVTLYQMGWRLGGKAASGRNRDLANRTEEHGLHLWMGFYENAFRLIRKCYGELGDYYSPRAKEGAKGAVRQSRFVDWQEAFMPEPWVGVAHKSLGEWRVWSAHFPPMPGLPGDELEEDSNPFTLRSYLARASDLLRALIHSAFCKVTEQDAAAPRAPFEIADVTPRALVDKMASLLRTGVLASASALYEAMSVLEVVLSGRFSLPNGDYKVLEFAEAIAANLRRQANDVVSLDEDMAPKLELVELVATVIVGILRDQLLSDDNGLDAINDEDCRAWLRRHGASQRALNSGIVRALYDMAFADVKLNEKDEPGLAAGQALRGALRMFFTYRGALFWKMRASMGDAVIAPLYEVLKNRGVHFEFFHRLSELTLEAPGKGQKPRVSSLTFDRQAELKPAPHDSGKEAITLKERALAASEYYPLDEDGCWPHRPDGKQLVGGDSKVDFEAPPPKDEKPGVGRDTKPSSSKTPVVVKDFDCVVLGISVGAIQGTCQALTEYDPNWSAMSTNVTTAATQSLQLWLNEGLEKLCKPPDQTHGVDPKEAHCKLPLPITVAGFVKPFDTWSDMTHIVAEEDWPRDHRPESLVYLCGALADKDAGNHDDWLDRVANYLDYALPLLWPGARDAETNGFRWELLVDPKTGQGVRKPAGPAAKRALLETQYYSINTKPSDRYVLSRPSSLSYRISPLDDSYANLTVAGDWTDCGFNEGCVEAAVMSGMLAAHAISCEPKLEDIIGFDHP